MHRFWPDDKPQPLHAVAATTTTGKRAVMRIFDPIDSDGAPWGISAKDFTAALDALPSDVDTIELHINSPGGHATDGIAILNSLRQHPAKVDVVVDGLAASAASYVAMAGDTVSMAPSATMMIHDPSAMAFGQATTMRMAADMLDTLGQSMADIYAGRAGGLPEEWRQAMQPGTWYSAQEAVDAGLADRVLPETGASSTPKAQFDLSVYADARREPFIPAARAACTCGPDGKPAVAGAQHRDECAHTPPAEPPEKHPTTEEAVTMTETELKALRERLGLGQDADEATVTAAVIADALTAKPDDTPPEITDEAIVAHVAKLDPEQAKALTAKLGTNEPAVPDGKVLVSQTMLDELKAGAADGSAARKKQLETERDDAIAKAFSEGKISADRRDTWKAAWDKDPEGTKADLDSLGVRFPVAKTSGYAGSDGTDGDGVKPFTDDEAEALAALAGTTKEALLNG